MTSKSSLPTIDNDPAVKSTCPSLIQNPVPVPVPSAADAPSIPDVSPPSLHHTPRAQKSSTSTDTALPKPNSTSPSVPL